MQPLAPARLDAIIKKCFQERGLFPGKEIVDKNDLLCITQMMKAQLSKESSLLELNAPLYVIGDLHGQYTDLLRYFDETDITKDKYLFLGDYVDRGPRSIEILTLIFSLKLRYPDRFFLLRGNHEAENINRLYGKRRFDSDMWRGFCDVFRYLPVSALIDNKILCLHGGIGKDLKTLDDLRSIVRPTDIPEDGLLCDILWADPSTDSFGFVDNIRGVSYTFGPDVAEEFMKNNGLELVCRAHQVVENGFEFCFGKKILTLFSAPNYCNSFSNSGAMMKVYDDLRCTFITLAPPTIE
ncbi:Serine/threonine-protein phosphatase [Entamoeba marina]